MGRPHREERTAAGQPGVYEAPAVSPDGKRVALMVTEGGSQDIWVYDLQRDAMTRLTFGGGSVYAYPTWSPDGKPEQFLTSTFADGLPAFSSDGHWLAYGQRIGQERSVRPGRPANGKFLTPAVRTHAGRATDTS